MQHNEEEMTCTLCDRLSINNTSSQNAVQIHPVESPGGPWDKPWDPTKNRGIPLSFFSLSTDRHNFTIIFLCSRLPSIFGNFSVLSVVHGGSSISMSLLDDFREEREMLQKNTYPQKPLGVLTLSSPQTLPHSQVPQWMCS